MTYPILDLYYFDSCPYCQRVLKAIDDYKIKLNFKNIYDDSNNMQKLIDITGKKTVPCLFIDGNPKHESLDIIEWLKSNKDILERTK